MSFEGVSRKGKELIDSILSNLFERWNYLTPVQFNGDVRKTRRAQLLIRFGFLGAVFGCIFILFYALIGHYYGAAIVGVCSLTLLTVPFLLNRTASNRIAGNVISGSLLAGFTGLSLIEGGMHGHAVAWLAGIPLCSLLLSRRDDALKWALVSTAVALIFGICHYKGIEFPSTYPKEWALAVDAAGFAALVPFMFLLGYIFESTRQTAFANLEEAHNELSEANDHLIQLNSEKNAFLDIAAHDLKNPLGAITGFSNLILEFKDLSREEIEEYSGEIHNAADRMMEIISNLLDVQAIEAGQMNLKSQKCQIDREVGGLLKVYQQAAQKKSIEIIYINEGGDLSARADRGALVQVLDNLISNAVKYSPFDSEVTIHSACRRDSVVISISDKGDGLSVEDQAKLFKKFTRLTPRPTNGESSNGLGLWIVDRMAQGMGGRVTCQSELGVGSTFFLELPKWDDSDPRNRNSDALEDEGDEVSGLFLAG